MSEAESIALRQVFSLFGNRINIQNEFHDRRDLLYQNGKYFLEIGSPRENAVYETRKLSEEEVLKELQLAPAVTFYDSKSRKTILYTPAEKFSEFIHKNNK